MTTTIRRNLVIGLGGTGLNVVYSLKRKYESVFGTQRPHGTRFFVLDTTDAKPSGGVSLQPAEFIKLAVADAKRVLQHNPAIRRWFPTEPATLSAGWRRAEHHLTEAPMTDAPMTEAPTPMPA